jgi:hypothetical protein
VGADEPARIGPLLRGLFLKPMEAVTKTLMLRHHRPYLLEHIDERVLMARHDRGQDTHVLLQRLLSSEHALHLSAEEFEGDGISHGANLVLLA